MVVTLAPEQVKIKPMCELSMTLEDHRDIGSTPPEYLLNNPGKTKADLMDDQQILEFLGSKKRLLTELLYKHDRKSLITYNLVAEELAKSIQYLEEIGRLPKKSKKRKI